MKHLVNILLITLLQGLVSFTYSQVINDTLKVNVMGDPFPCFYLEPDEPIKIFNHDIGYTGKIVIEATVDTLSLTLYDYRIVFANLYAINKPYDTIYIRSDLNYGNIAYIDSIKEKFIKHISYIKLVRSNMPNCVFSNKCVFPIKIKQ